MIYVVYQDDGPKRGTHGAQAVSVTSAWLKLFEFDTDKEVLDFLRNLDTLFASRENPRAPGVFTHNVDYLMDNPLFDPISRHILRRLS